MDVGLRLKAVRTAKRLSQRQLAARSGVTNGMICMIEQNQTSPSVSSLKKILDGLSMTLSEFFSADEEANGKIFFAASELREIAPLGDPASGALAVELRQVGDTVGRAIQMLHETYAPGADTGEETYAHEGEEAGIIISGQVEITVGDQSRVLGPGDAYLFDSRIPHRFRNPYAEAAIIVSACTPPTF